MYVLCIEYIIKGYVHFLLPVDFRTIGSAKVLQVIRAEMDNNCHVVRASHNRMMWGACVYVRNAHVRFLVGNCRGGDY